MTNRWRIHTRLMSSLLLPLYLATVQAEDTFVRELMSGTPYAAKCHVKIGERPGNTVMVIGGLHGNEPAGYLAARRLLAWRIEAGTLAVIPDAHAEAIRRNVRGYPGNFNNMFPGKPAGDAMEKLAHAVFEQIRQIQPDVLLTLHESAGMHADNPKSYGQSFCYDFVQLDEIMDRARARLNAAITNRKHHFLRFVEPHPNCPTYQGWMQFGIPGVSIETSQTLPLETRIEHQLLAVQAFLREFKIEYCIEAM